jgi:hypothetical protein
MKKVARIDDIEALFEKPVGQPRLDRGAGFYSVRA